MTNSPSSTNMEALQKPQTLETIQKILQGKTPEELIAVLQDPKVSRENKGSIHQILQTLSIQQESPYTLEEFQNSQELCNYMQEYKNELITMLGGFPSQEQSYFLQKIKKFLDQGDGHFEGYKAFNGLLTEMRVEYRRLQEGYTLDERRELTVSYLGADQKLISTSIQSDVPLLVDGKLWINETKNYKIFSYGFDNKDYKQLAKYQAALEQGLISGVTIDIFGRVAPRLLEEIKKYPGIQIIYSFLLPSGKFHQIALTSPENALSIPQENNEVLGDQPYIDVLNSLAPKDLLEILYTSAGYDQRQLMQIKDIKTLQQYEQDRDTAVWEQILKHKAS